ncbi:hypothetical protein HFD88_004824 [Aspergillus terreus]|nr:hypothetical protein HFD88_004824 [Aspergillus terreus]
MARMEVQVAPESRAALKEHLTLRCVVRAKYHRDKSRRSAEVISWSQSLVQILCTTLLREVGQETSGFSTQLNIVQMIGSPNIVYICFDLFLDECDERLRTEISEDFRTQRPIHYIIQKRRLFYVRRDERADQQVAGQYSWMSCLDKGPRPFFSDLANPPVYHNGRRIEDFKAVASPEGSDAEGNDSKKNEDRKQEDPDEKEAEPTTTGNTPATGEQSQDNDISSK